MLALLLYTAAVSILLSLLDSREHITYHRNYVATAITQMVDNWYEEIEERKIVVAVMLIFPLTFSIIDHELMLK